uniref:Tryptophan-rich sensory protein n=1 Tax=viral metagenome TaxID=1070528 RepID=A0A6C0LI27_9ZZZZ
MNIDYVYIVLPLILGIVTSFFCRPSNVSNVSNVSNKVKIPSEIFIIIWPILYLLIGYCWYLSRKNKTCNIMFWILNILLCSWLIIFSCLNNKNIAYLILILCLLSSILIYTCLSSELQKYLMCPLIIWLIIALIISY